MLNRIDVRASITQAKFNEDAFNILGTEVAIASVALGLLTQSWWVFGIVFLGTAVGLVSKKFTMILCFFFSLCWAAIGYFIGVLFFSTSASIVLAVIGLLASFGVHSSAIEWVRDLNNQS